MITTTTLRRGILMAALFALPSTASAATEPFRSIKALPSSNGHGAIAWDRATLKLNQFMEHAYRYPDEGKESSARSRRGSTPSRRARSLTYPAPASFRSIAATRA